VTTARDQAEARLRAAMDRYGFKDADRHHDTSGGPCWCGPAVVCSRCALGTCACFEPLVVVHRRSC
jgi:hypothetical protein